MGSGGSRDDYREVYRGYSVLSDERSTPKAREVALESHRDAVKSARERVVRGEYTPTVAKEDKNRLVDHRLARNAINRPPQGAESVTIIVIDNSGSNAATSEMLRNRAGLLLEALGVVAPRHAVAMAFVSDHCDGHLMDQRCDYALPEDPQSERVLVSSLDRVHGAGGGDVPEAFECGLADLCELDFGHVPRERRHMVLVTDSVAHGMGWRGDEGCPKQGDIRATMRRVRSMFATFELVGTSADAEMGRAQRDFFENAQDAALNFIDLSGVDRHEHRLGLVSPSITFLAARRRGPQSAQAYLSMLCRKWLSEPIFGKDTDRLARQRIRQFGTYLVGIMSQREIDDMMALVLVE